jgi:MFS family permease
MATGGFLFFPLSAYTGRSSAIFWSLFGLLLSQIWAALMIHKSDYYGFIVSRVFGAFFGVVTAVLGPGFLVDLFFLHQRGRAFTVFHWCFSFGTVAGPTLSAFISAKGSWTYAYWWTAGLAGLTLFPVFFFLHDTTWDRNANAVNTPAPTNFFANRFATFCMRATVTPKISITQTVSLKTYWKMPEAEMLKVENCCHALFDYGYSCHSNSECVHFDSLWILRRFKFPITSMVAKAHRSWRLWLLS